MKTICNVYRDTGIRLKVLVNTGSMGKIRGSLLPPRRKGFRNLCLSVGDEGLLVINILINQLFVHRLLPARARAEIVCIALRHYEA